MTVVGFTETPSRLAGLIVSVADCETPLRLAEIVGDFWVETATVFTVNVALVLPALTVTEAGKVAELALLDSFTIAPAFPAGPVSVTVPATEVPPTTALGLRLTDAGVGGVMVRLPVFETVPLLAAIVATCCFDTATVFTVNVAELCPVETVTLDGTVAAESLLDRETAKPPGPAAPFRMTIPVEGLPPVTVAGLRLTEAREAGLILILADCDCPFNVAAIVAVA
jgi:hypothetical protein